VTNRFAYLSSAQVKQLPPETLIIQPIGAVEQHGPHLPLITDALIAETVATRAVERSSASAQVLPTLAYGTSNEHLGFSGTISMSARTLIDVALDVGRSVHRSGLQTLVFVNGHGGQPQLLELTARDIRAETGLRVFVITVGRLGLPAGVTAVDASFGYHGGDVETSVMLALCPEAVDMSLAAPDGLAARDAFSGMDFLTLEGAVPTAWLTRDLSDSGVLGDPRSADAERGAQIVEHWVTSLAGAFDEIARFEFRPVGSRGE
jgi:creatinine amidohydrolase